MVSQVIRFFSLVGDTNQSGKNRMGFEQIFVIKGSNIVS